VNDQEDDPNSELAMVEEVGNVDQSSFYSDVTGAGGLSPAIQAQLEAIGSPLCMKRADPDFNGLFPFEWEVVKQKHRFSQIMIAKHQRLFMLDFWDRGICLAHGSTPLLPKVAEVIHVWVAEGVSTGVLQRRFPFVGVESSADSHEQGAAAEVEQKWQALYSHVKSDESKVALTPLVERAMEVPVLRRLFPFTSLDWLCFSRCTGYPFSGDCPSACSTRFRFAPRLTPGQREALGPPRPYTVADSKGNFLGEGDLAEVVELIIQHLPPNCGPAVQGTADDLG
jgi:Family of unknown function (DUF6193)